MQVGRILHQWPLILSGFGLTLRSQELYLSNYGRRKILKISKLFIYPIKSCAGIEVEELRLLPYGSEYDRQFVIVDGDGKAITQREEPRLSLVRTTFWDTRFLVAHIPATEGLLIRLKREDGEEREAVVWGDTCKGLDEGDEIAEALSTFLGRAVRLVRYVPTNPRLRMSSYLGERVSISFADAYPLLIISEASLRDLNRRLPAKHLPLEMNRFRPNIVIGHARPYEEDKWQAISVNGVLLRGANQCVRCATTLVDQATGRTGKEPLRTLGKYRKTSKGVVFGRNFIHLGEGIIRRKDVVDTP